MYKINITLTIIDGVNFDKAKYGYVVLHRFLIKPTIDKRVIIIALELIIDLFFVKTKIYKIFIDC